MYHDDPIPEDEHAKWFPSTEFDTNNSRYRIAELDSVPVGWMGLTRIESRHRSCEWGGYLSPDAPKGVGLGKALVCLSLEMAFEDLRLNRVVVEVLVGNTRALGLYESLGFVRESRLRQRAWLSSGPQDAFGLSMLAGEWNSLRQIHLESLRISGVI